MFWSDIFIVGVGWVMILFFQLCLLYFSCISNGEKIIFLSPPAEPAGMFSPQHTTLYYDFWGMVKFLNLLNAIVSGLR